MKIILAILVLAVACFADSFSSDIEISKQYYSDLIANAPAGGYKLYESFEGEWPPAGWLVTSESGAAGSWEQNNDAAKSGFASAACMPGCVDADDKAWLVTPSIDLSDMTQPRLEVYEAALNWSSRNCLHEIKISTTVQDDPSAFFTYLPMTPSNYSINGFNGFPLVLDLSPYAGTQTFYIAFVYAGKGQDTWYIDDIAIMEPQQKDAVAVELQIDPYCEPGGRVSAVGKVKNAGRENDSFAVHFGYFDETQNPVILETKQVTDLRPSYSELLEFTPISVPENKQLNFFIECECEGDFYTENNRAVKSSHAFTSPKSFVLIEKGTGTWCPYCPASAVAVDKLVEEFDGQVAAMEYHSGSGSNYDIDEGQARLAFYGIGSFPTAVFNGGQLLSGGGSADSYQGTLNNYHSRVNTALNQMTGFEVDAKYVHEDGKYKAKTTITALGFTANSAYRLFYGINESHISESWQDLDSLQFVARDIYPSPMGKLFMPADGVEPGDVLIDHSDIDVPAIGNPENFELLVFVQDMQTKEIFAGTLAEKVDVLDPFVIEVEQTKETGNPGDELVMDVQLFNRSDAPMDVQVIRTPVSVPEDWSSAICVDVCLAPFVNETQFSIPAGGAQTVSLHVFSGAMADSAIIDLTFKTGSFAQTVSFSARTEFPAHVTEQSPYAFQLFGAYPNPFNPTTHINYSVAEHCRSASLFVHSVIGQTIAEIPLETSTGLHVFNFDAAELNMSSGVYFYHIHYQSDAGALRSDIKKLTLLK